MDEVSGNVAGMSLAQGYTPTELPKRVEINQVTNGFTVSLMGGKQEKAVPFRHNLHIANTLDEIVDLVRGHLS